MVDVHFVPGTFSLESMSSLFEWDGWECFFMKSTPGGWCEAKALTNRVFV